MVSTHQLADDQEPSVDFAVLGEIQYYYSVNQNIVVTEGKEINRDSISSG